MRRLKRRSVASKMMEQNYSANAKRKKVGSCGHEAVKNAENNIIASDVDVHTCHDSDNDGDTDAQYESRMGRSRGTIKQEYSHLTENLEVFQYDSRWMRRLKRRSIASEMERHHSSNAKRKNVGSFGDKVVKSAENSGNVLEEELDLDKVDVIGDGNIIASDIDVNTSHDNDNDNDGNNLIYMPENGVAVVYGEECDQSSTDFEPIIPSQHYEDSPFICSEIVSALQMKGTIKTACIEKDSWKNLKGLMTKRSLMNFCK